MRTSALRDDRGALLVHVALGLIVLMAFTTFVADYGLLWVARRQAQNSADAAALAGAIALAFDDSVDLTTSGPAKQSAFQISQENLIWGQPPSVLDSDIQFAACPSGTGNCVRVNVYRNFARGNQLPVFFGYFVGLTSQGIRATATAAVQPANATNCLKPWAVIDKWEEHWPTVATWTLASTYDKYDTHGDPDPLISPPDLFIEPTTTSFGTGFHPYEADGRTFTSDWGRRMVLKEGNAQSDSDYATGWFAALALTDSGGGSDYNVNIKHCVGKTYKVGDIIETEPGMMEGPTKQGVIQDVDSLIGQDPTAYWDTSMNGGRGGVRSPFSPSPRIVPIPLVNPDIMIEVQKGGRTTIPISNIMGFFIDSFDQPTKSIIGYMQPMPGFFDAGGGPTGPGGGFLTTIVLVR